MKKSYRKMFSLLLVLLISLCIASPVSAASISKKSVTLCTGQSIQLKISGTKSKVKWSSGNKKVAIVNQTGKVTAKGRGTTAITSKVGKSTFKCVVTVESPKINKTSVSLYKGKTCQLKMLNTKQKYKWSSSNSKIASVSNGKVTGKNKGTSYIYCKSASGKTFKCKVVVKVSTASGNPKMLLPNQKECGDAVFYIEYGSQKSTGGKVVSMQLYKNFPMGYINFSAYDVEPNLTTFIYIDGTLWESNKGTSVSGGGSLDDKYLTSGLHAVEMVQFSNNNRSGSVASYHRAMYKVSYK